MQKKIGIIFFVFLTLSKTIAAQKVALPLIEPLLNKKYQNSHCQIMVSDTTAFEYFAKNNGFLFNKTSKNNVYTLYLNDSTTLKKCLASSLIQFIDVPSDRKAFEEYAVRGLDLSANNINTIHAYYPFYNGKNLTISIKENAFDPTDIDFKGRVLTSQNTPKRIEQHASAMTSIVGGAGNSQKEGKGVAWASQLTSANFANLLPNTEGYFDSLKISVQNHSYGTGIENYYGIETQAYDDLVHKKPYLLHVFSAGNIGEQSAKEGFYRDLKGFANLTGQFKQSKNTISVGAEDSLGNLLSLSSRGPTFDGRIKPELTAFGNDGSSGATALVSGVALVLQQAYFEHTKQLPNASLIKAILCNAAKDKGAKGIDYSTGFGHLDAYKSLKNMIEKKYFEDSLTNQNSIFIRKINVPKNTKQLKLTLAWTDPAATINAPLALVNDLDLTLKKNTKTWQPYVLNAFPSLDSLKKEAILGRDSLNNIEQVVLENPEMGVYEVCVNANFLKEKQLFSIAYDFTPQDTFYWTSPTKSDYILPNNTSILRWENTFDNTIGIIEMRYINQNNWFNLATDRPLSIETISATIPSQNGLAQLRMRLKNQIFLSDTFTVASVIEPKIGFYCRDSALLFWQKVPQAEGYQVYGLKGEYLTPLSILKPIDSFFIIKPLNLDEKHYAIAPIFEGKSIAVSPSIDFAKQGVACYIKTFLPSTIPSDIIRFRLTLGTLFRVKTIVFEKKINNIFKEIQKIDPLSISPDLTIQTEDSAPTDGISFYRIRLILDDDKEIVSDLESVYFLKEKPYLAFPNPAKQGDNFTVLGKEEKNITLTLMNYEGKVMNQTKSNSRLVDISIKTLSKGFYILHILDEQNNVIFREKIIIL